MSGASHTRLLDLPDARSGDDGPDLFVEVVRAHGHRGVGSTTWPWPVQLARFVGVSPSVIVLSRAPLSAEAALPGRSERAAATP
jgi:hypothetical protein